LVEFRPSIWARFIALSDQRAVHHGYGRIGFPNLLLCGMGGEDYAKYIYHDIVSGTSGKYSAVPSYDLMTGFWHLAGHRLHRELIQAVQR